MYGIWALHCSYKTVAGLLLGVAPPLCAQVHPFPMASLPHGITEGCDCCSVLQIAALMKDKAALEVKVSQAAVAPLEMYQQIDTSPKYGCKACG